MKANIAILLTLLLTGCAAMEMSENAGGFGVVSCDGNPVEDATVNITDINGTLSTVTQENGAFSIEPISRQVFGSLMSNPVYHNITLTVEKPGYQTFEKTVNKSVFGNAYIDFGDIQLEKL